MTEELDLNLLRVFDALMDTGSVKEAAARLHLSAPATSRALSRLRREMNDAILVRAGRGLVPTPFARRSAATVKTLLDAADGLRTNPAGSDPRSWRRTFTIRLNDALVPVLAPRLTRRIAGEAPEVRLRFARQDSKEPDLLRDGSIDLDVTAAVPSPPDLHTAKLFTDRFVAVVAADSELGHAPHLTADDLCRHPHVSASRRGLFRGPLDDALERIGRSRHVAAVVPSYTVGALMALEQDVLCLVPRVTAAHLIERGVPLRAHQVPFDLPATDIELRWHRRLHDDPASRWLRDRIRAVIQPLTAAPSG
ncbi:LysR family transcriptional regulator [Amycolatopsis jiangsuensis]|uniref:DNA-binding transcriptional LysR family regulator n=1 Tax=Amycolatopsis jiangsuensis TaxID=1181879 RepID=A0A840IKS5_9PSEU|nr:LysR family transcriptional regulator [Amycolatopsis jiangsuensis]MBB4682906.1 DNA-binding transcriptional LysR family regulator [Amycolatopsis jiangsuensis]